MLKQFTSCYIHCQVQSLVTRAFSTAAPVHTALTFPTLWARASTYRPLHSACPLLNNSRLYTSLLSYPLIPSSPSTHGAFSSSSTGNYLTCLLFFHSISHRINWIFPTWSPWPPKRRSGMILPSAISACPWFTATLSLARTVRIGIALKRSWKVWDTRSRKMQCRKSSMVTNFTFSSPCASWNRADSALKTS